MPPTPPPMRKSRPPMPHGWSPKQSKPPMPRAWSPTEVSKPPTRVAATVIMPPMPGQACGEKEDWGSREWEP
eukprot:7698341-Alexandrium_andersonii.AAC.1